LVASAWLFALLGVAKILYPVRNTLPNDFIIFFIGGQLAAEGRISQLYHPPAYEPWIAELRNRGEFIRPSIQSISAYYFVRPAFAAFLYVPFTWLPFRTAFHLALLGNITVLGILLWKLPLWFPLRDFFSVGVLRACLILFIPFISAIAHGQDILLLTLIAAYSTHLALQNREVPAGILLAACSVKPHLILAMPALLLAAGKRRMLWSFLATGVLLAGLSFAAIGQQERPRVDRLASGVLH
jgi:hypothetical protein